MIVVLADDFTGAAELAGVGLMHGLTVELHIEDAEPPSSDMLVIATDTRSKGIEEAVEEVSKLTKKLGGQKLDWIYKKVDSVLRGHILEETQVMLDVLDKKGAILVCANPALGRTIVDGNYYINGEPLQSTSFSEDPEFDISTSSVARLLSRNGSTPVFKILNPKEFTGEGNIVVGEASTDLDLDFWADKALSDWLPVGAAGFFQALLSAKGKPLVNGNHTSAIPEDAKTLYLCGSTFQGSRDKVYFYNVAGPHVCYMPEDLFWQRGGFEKKLEEWREEVSSVIQKHNKAIIAVKEAVIPDPGKSNWIKNNFALLVKGVFEQIQIEVLIIEGGGTASAVLNNMEFTRLVPLHQFQQGVIRMKVENMTGLNLTLKPGSYTWPDTVWKF